MPRLDDVTVPSGVGDGLIAGRVTRPAADGVLMAVFGPAHAQQQMPVMAPAASEGTPAVGAAVWAIRDDRGQLVAVAGGWRPDPLTTVVPHARLRRTSTLSCPSGVVTVIPWEQATYDHGTSSPQWSASASTAWTCRQEGLYRFTATVPIAAEGSPDTRRVMGVSRVRDGVGIDVMVQAETGADGDAATMNGATEHRCMVGDTVLTYAYQDSGAMGSIDPALLRFTASFASA